MSAFLALTDAVVTVLSAPPALAGGNIRRGRAMTVPTSSSTAIEVRMLRSTGEPLYEGGAEIAWTSHIGIEAFARAAAGADGEEAIDDLLAAVYARMAVASPPAGCEMWAVNPMIEWDVVEADETLVRASLTLSANHYTGPGSLAAYS